MGSRKDSLMDEPFPQTAHKMGKKLENYTAMLHFACAWITFRASGLFG